MRLSRTNKKGPHRGDAGGPVIVRHDEFYVPTKPTKTVVATVITMAGLLGIQLTTGTAQLVVMVLQVLLVAYGVWRAHNRPKSPVAGHRIGGFMPPMGDERPLP